MGISFDALDAADRLDVSSIHNRSDEFWIVKARLFHFSDFDREDFADTGAIAPLAIAPREGSCKEGFPGRAFPSCRRERERSEKKSSQSHAYHLFVPFHIMTLRGLSLNFQ
jgi:hypothetical protein